MSLWTCYAGREALELFAFSLLLRFYDARIRFDIR